MALYKATITKTERLPDGSIIEKGMTVQYSHINFPWDGNGLGTEAINNAFLRVYGINLKTNHALSPGFVNVEKVE
ncbi:DUF6140 family protein [Flavobacterium sp. CBA20B-1]|uniref:DUF6140 family protein n=1 Tax=unclassified Flavobacterium TaxID=196869 RepID=UPI0022251E64|nr:MULTISPECIES: DUF6140 family protein [unclassified Flavobacterium]WCM42111.1 DUF6140 family protein [Flavobacterium sp. CBA20B-1]